MASQHWKNIFNKEHWFMWFVYKGYLNWLSDESFISRRFKYTFGREIDLRNPKTFNEKLQWLKLHDRNPLYTTMVDKLAVKKYVAEIIGDQYIIPTLGVWDSFEDIDFSILPEQFVLKCTHDSGGLVIVRNKSKLNINSAREKINRSLKKNYYYLGREWPYKNVKPRIIAEKYIQPCQSEKKMKSAAVLNDYKIYTFNGKAKLCMINQDRGIHTRADYFDREFNWLDFTWGYDHADVPPKKPRNYQKMFNLAENLAVGTMELRVDFYEVDGKLYFGELTFFDGSGFDPILPVEWDYKLGSWIKLPER